MFHAHYAGPAGMLPIAVLAALVYLSLKFGRRTADLCVIALCVLTLLHFKYHAFFNELTGFKLAIPAVPLGISFFVFEFVHLLKDRMDDKLEVTPSPIQYVIFTIFYPSLAAGPVKRIKQFLPELERLGRPATPLIYAALGRILIGYFKKCCIGDAIAIDMPSADLSEWHGSVASLSLMLGVRIYADFSGYSDIAIGTASLLNIKLPENFSFPYLATNISEFWQRWHISLSSWIRDYVFIPIGGSRASRARTFFNLSVAMILCGLWHGPAIHFVAWGLLHGCAVGVYHFWKTKKQTWIPTPLAWLFTFSFVQLSWLLFFYNEKMVWKFLIERPLFWAST